MCSWLVELPESKHQKIEHNNNDNVFPESQLFE